MVPFSNNIYCTHPFGQYKEEPRKNYKKGRVPVLINPFLKLLDNAFVLCYNIYATSSKTTFFEGACIGFFNTDGIVLRKEAVEQGSVTEVQIYWELGDGFEQKVCSRIKIADRISNSVSYSRTNIEVLKAKSPPERSPTCPKNGERALKSEEFRLK